MAKPVNVWKKKAKFCLNYSQKRYVGKSNHLKVETKLADVGAGLQWNYDKILLTIILVTKDVGAGLADCEYAAASVGWRVGAWVPDVDDDDYDEDDDEYVDDDDDDDDQDDDFDNQTVGICMVAHKEHNKKIPWVAHIGVVRADACAAGAASY